MVSVAQALEPVLQVVLGADLPVRVEFWDGSGYEAPGAGAVLRFTSPNAIRRLLWAPNELGLARGYVAGEIDVEGDLFQALTLPERMAGSEGDLQLTLDRRARFQIARAARRIGALGPPLPPPPEEASLRGRRHSKRRDADAIKHHYDVSNDFYRIFLGETMTYSCAYFARADMTLEEAQTAKYELICRKLGLREGMRLLDVGCGWGGMVIHAARHHGVSALGITVSRRQAELAEKRVAETGVADRVKIRLQDYRDVDDGPFEAISSIGMFEHVGISQLERYFDTLYNVLAPEGRLLNHAISRPSPARDAIDPQSFIGRYVFPDGELLEVGTVVTAMQRLGYEVRDLEALREHYALTLRAWVANLEANWDEAVSFAGHARARIWRLYMAACAVNFEAGRINIHQLLGVKTSPRGSSGMPATRSA